MIFSKEPAPKCTSLYNGDINEVVKNVTIYGYFFHALFVKPQTFMYTSSKTYAW